MVGFLFRFFEVYFDPLLSIVRDKLLFAVLSSVFDSYCVREGCIDLVMLIVRFKKVTMLVY